MSNRIPPMAQTWFADSPHKDQNDTRVERNRRRNARQRTVTTLAAPGMPWGGRVADENRRKERRRGLLPGALTFRGA